VRPKSEAKLEDIIPVEMRMLVTAFCRPAEKFHSSKSSQHVNGSVLALSEASLLLTSVTNRLGDYRTSAQEDLEILDRLKTNDNHQFPIEITRKRYEMAVQVRKGEKEILHQVLQLLRDFVDRHTRQMAGDSTKRKRNEMDTATISKKQTTRR
jgi:N-lysine methyltransferase SETD6